MRDGNPANRPQDQCDWRPIYEQVCQLPRRGHAAVRKRFLAIIASSTLGGAGEH